VNITETTNLIGEINLFFPQVTVTKERIKAWHALLKDEEYCHVLERLRKHSKQSSFPPTIRDLLKREFKPIIVN
jgi:hypothetical protein